MPHKRTIMNLTSPGCAGRQGFHGADTITGCTMPEEGSRRKMQTGLISHLYLRLTDSGDMTKDAVEST